MKRRHLTDCEKRDIIRAQGGDCALCNKCIIGAVLGVEYDHTVPVALGNDKKPDRALCLDCHKSKTRRDVKAISKVKRIIKKKGPRLHSTFKTGRKLQSRGFSKEWSRRFDGTTVRRARAGEGAESVASP